MTPLTCAQMRDLAPELALGLLTGAERAAALAHLEGCAACRAEVASLTDVGEAVLALAPEVPPSAGFESRVLARIGPDRSAGPVGAAAPAGFAAEAGAGAPAGPDVPTASARPGDPVDGSGPPRRPGRRRRWATRRAVLAAAAAAVVVVAAGGIVAAALDGRDGSPEPVATAELRTSAGRVVGEARVRGADPATVTVEMNGWLDDLRGYGRSGEHAWWLRVDTRDGGEQAYALPLGEPDPWHVPLDDDGGGGGDGDSAVAAVAVVDETGRTWCEARFAPGGAGE